MIWIEENRSDWISKAKSGIKQTFFVMSHIYWKTVPGSILLLNEVEM